jgi:hypothetical protein
MPHYSASISLLQEAAAEQEAAEAAELVDLDI